MVARAVLGRGLRGRGSTGLRGPRAELEITKLMIVMIMTKKTKQYYYILIVIV